MARLKSCWNLATGVVVLGVTCIILNLISIAYNTRMLSHLDDNYSQFQSQFPAYENDYAPIRTYFNRAYAAIYVSIAFQVISTLFNVSLIYAARQKRHRWMLPWLGWYCLFAGLHALYLLASNTDDAWFLRVNLLGTTIFYIYLILVITSYYLNLRDEAEGGEKPPQNKLQPLQRPLHQPLPPGQVRGWQAQQSAPPAQHAPGGQAGAPPPQAV